jgi:hypothetical protein
MQMQNLRRAALLAVFPLFLMECTSLPPWSPVPTGQTSVYGKIETAVNAISFISFSDNPGIAAISVEYRFGRAAPRYALIADGPARAAIEEICGKYFDWQTRARDNQVEIVKEIRTSTLAQMYRSGSGWEPGGDRDLRFVFSSRMDADNTLRTTLRVWSHSFFDGRDQFVLDDQQVRDFADSLQDSAVTAGFGAAKKKQETIDMFN